MSNFEQDYNFNQPQNNNNLPHNDEDRTVKKITAVWCILVAIPTLSMHLTPLLEHVIDTGGMQSVTDFVLNIVFGVIILCIIAHHVIAIIGKIKFPKNKKMHEVFVADLILVVFVIIGALFIAGMSLMCDAMCGDCG